MMFQIDDADLWVGIAVFPDMTDLTLRPQSAAETKKLVAATTLDVVAKARVTTAKVVCAGATVRK